MVHANVHDEWLWWTRITLLKLWVNGSWQQQWVDAKWQMPMHSISTCEVWQDWYSTELLVPVGASTALRCLAIASTRPLPSYSKLQTYNTGLPGIVPGTCIYRRQLCHILRKSEYKYHVSIPVPRRMMLKKYGTSTWCACIPVHFPYSTSVRYRYCSWSGTVMNWWSTFNAGMSKRHRKSEARTKRG